MRSTQSCWLVLLFLLQLYSVVLVGGHRSEGLRGGSRRRRRRRMPQRPTTHNEAVVFSVAAVVVPNHQRPSQDDFYAPSTMTTMCDPNWEPTQRDWTVHVAQWKAQAPSCYYMNLTLPSEPIFKGPFHDVLVVDNVVVAPAGLPMIPTMSAMFETVHRDCMASCPQVGARRCDVHYQNNQHHHYYYVSEAHLEWSEDDTTTITTTTTTATTTTSLNEEKRATRISWNVTGFRLCDEPAVPVPARRTPTRLLE